MIIKLAVDEQREEKLGNKGKFLLQMKKQGFNVPGGYILDTDIYDEIIAANKIDSSVRSALEKLNTKNVKEVSDELISIFEGVKIPSDITAQIDGLASDDKLYAHDVKDKILVTKMTDPGWVFLLASAKGVISEKGSLLSHTAIISRELNIPSVVGVDRLTDTVKTGDLIRMDGGTGKIEILGRA
ncbi:MAG: hypothetical protein KBG42_03690 [Lachnospiraceae bacterium]|nr:hypothetical protein [Lachnospiraceae bacterium]